ncbi:MAG: alpha-glucosidase [Clostridia bacterium]|nr:alpha-glucosidase [Clostridia bacterium]
MKQPWWKSAVAYQIYPRSFKDSNGDGIGDIRGIIEKLDHLQELGIDVVWISPLYKSPMDDCGYDISDYYAIDPLFGTNEDMYELIDEAKKRGIKIIMDLVINHCSDEHEWFQKALADPNCEEAEYFYFRESKDGPPNNWRSMFGGSVWENVGGDRYYMHLFGKKQPDLNWENPKLREKLYENIRWWLDRGIAGFRVDAIVHIKKEESLASHPADGDDGMCGLQGWARNTPGINDFLAEMRDKAFTGYDAECMTVAEAPGVALEDLKYYVGDNGFFSMLFDFTYSEINFWGLGWENARMKEDIPTTELRDSIFKHMEDAQKVGWTAVYLENHDYSRSVNKYLPTGDQRDYHGVTMLATMYMNLRGTPFIYQGQEIGTTNYNFKSIDEVNDISTHNHWGNWTAAGLPMEQKMYGLQYSRDQNRIPMQWTAGENAGFTDGKAWLPINENHVDINVESQKNDDNSVLAYYKKLVKARKESVVSEALSLGDFEPALLEDGEIIAYKRIGEESKAFVINNYLKEDHKVTLPCDVKSVVVSNYDDVALDGRELTLKPYQAIVFEI